MARITIEDCLKKVDNPFVLVNMAVKRVKQIKEGSEPLVECDNREVVTALREIAAGKVILADGKEKEPKEQGEIKKSSEFRPNKK
jgi:DNA-directed RNA polymerase subunit omega